MTNQFILAEGKIVIKDFGINYRGLFVYDNNGLPIHLTLPSLADNGKQFKVILEEIKDNGSD